MTENYDVLRQQRERIEQRVRDTTPIDILLFCPSCGEQHVDQPQPEKEWTNPPHKSHECQFCSHVWRPADVPTNGVLTIQTKGQVDRSPRPRHFAAGPIAAVLEELKQTEGDDRYHVNFRNGLASARQKILSAIRHDPNPLQPDLVPMPVIADGQPFRVVYVDDEVIIELGKFSSRLDPIQAEELAEQLTTCAGAARQGAT